MYLRKIFFISYVNFVYKNRNYELADIDTVPQIIKNLLQVLGSKYMGLILSNMTGLSLHPSVPKNADDDSCDEELSAQENSSFNENDAEKKRKLSCQNDDNENNTNANACTSTSSEAGKKKLKLNHNDNDRHKTNDQIVKDLSKFNLEIRRWKQGFYTLITDDDTEIKTKALDLMVIY